MNLFLPFRLLLAKIFEWNYAFKENSCPVDISIGQWKKNYISQEKSYSNDIRYDQSDNVPFVLFMQGKVIGLKITEYYENLLFMLIV